MKHPAPALTGTGNPGEAIRYHRSQMPKALYEQAFATLDAWVGKPAGGLPEEFF